MQNEKRENDFNGTQRKGQHRGKWVLLLLAVLLLGGVFLWQQQKVAREKAQMVTATVETPTPTATPTETPTPTPTPTPEPDPLEKLMAEPVEQYVDFPSFWEVNEDVYAYLEIPDTVVSYPILQSSHQEEDYYLDHTLYDVAGLPGSIYTRKDNAKDFTDYLTVVYGHDMLNGSYFGTLRYYAEAEYLNKHNAFFIYLPTYRFDYTIIAEAVFNDDSLTARYPVGKKVAVRAFLRDAERMGEMIRGLDGEAKIGDRLVVLSTCIGPRPENRRLIIGRLDAVHPVLEETPSS